MKVNTVCDTINLPTHLDIITFCDIIIVLENEVRQMKILIKIQRNPKQQFLVSLPDCSIIREVKSLLNKGAYSKAITTALSKGTLLQEVNDIDLPHIDADLILSENHVYFDLM